MQGYGATECGVASATNQRDHGLGTVGRTIPPVQVKLADDGEILVCGPTLFSATGAIGRRAPAPSRPTAGIGPATSAATTRPAIWS